MSLNSAPAEASARNAARDLKGVLLGGVELALDCGPAHGHVADPCVWVCPCRNDRPLQPSQLQLQALHLDLRRRLLSAHGAGGAMRRHISVGCPGLAPLRCRRDGDADRVAHSGRRISSRRPSQGAGMCSQRRHHRRKLGILGVDPSRGIQKVPAAEVLGGSAQQHSREVCSGSI